jgi:PST family polysaccharide transporter
VILSQLERAPVADPTVAADAELRQSRSLGRKVRTGVMWAYLRSGIFAIVAIPTTVILARLLSPADFGIAAAATFFGHLAARLSNGGMGIALVRVKELREEHISSVFVINGIIALVSSVTLLVAAPFIADFYRTPELRWVIPLVTLDFLLGALSMVSQALLTRAMRYREMATLASAELTAMSFASVILAVMGFGFWSLVLGAICGSTVKWLWGVKLAGWHLRFRFDRAAARELTSFALGTYTKGLLEYLSLNVDNLVIGRVLGITPLGFYDKAFSSVNRVYRNLTVVGPSVSFRAFAIIQDEPERFRRAYHKIVTTVTLVGYIVFAALATMAPHLIVVLFGSKWAASVIPFQLLCASGVLKILNVYSSTAANARGWVWSTVWRQLIQVSCIVGGVYLAAPWGINGASAAVLASTVVMFFLLQGMMRAATGLTWADLIKPQMPALWAAAALITLLWATDLAMRALVGGQNAPLALAAQGCVAALFCLAFVWWCPFREARTVMHEILNDLSPKLARFVIRSEKSVHAPASVVQP